MSGKIVGGANECKVCSKPYPPVHKSFGWIVVTTGGKKGYATRETLRFHKICPECSQKCDIQLT